MRPMEGKSALFIPKKPPVRFFLRILVNEEPVDQPTRPLFIP